MFLASVSPYNFVPPIQNEFTFGSPSLITNYPLVFAGSGVTFTATGISSYPMTMIAPDTIIVHGMGSVYPLGMAG